MEISGDQITINGITVSTERANNIMFVQCTMLKRAYTIDMETSPIHVHIEGYVPDKNDAKPDDTGSPAVAAAPARKMTETPKVQKKEGCRSCSEKK